MSAVLVKVGGASRQESRWGVGGNERIILQ